MIELEGRRFGPGNPMFVCEISSSHMGKYELAEQLIREAKTAGADAVKFQAFEPWHMAPKNGPRLTTGPWEGRTLYELYEEAYTPTEWLAGLFRLARDVGLIPFASVFHPEMIEVLEELEPAAYKIASAEGEWWHLILTAEDTGKVVMVSDGNSVLEPHCAWSSIPMACVSDYPAHCSNYSFTHYAGDHEFEHEGRHWGLSDHSMAPVTWIAAAALGASVIEAHLMLPESRPLDYRHSLLPLPFAGHIRVAKQAAEMAYGEPTDREPIEFARRMLWVKGFPEGHVVGIDDMVCLRSPDGIAPSEADGMVGETLTRGVSKWQPVQSAHGGSPYPS